MNSPSTVIDSPLARCTTNDPTGRTPFWLRFDHTVRLTHHRVAGAPGRSAVLADKNHGRKKGAQQAPRCPDAS
ncbi:hypothetical protein I553_1060 [Mycobacterium xenopi 4042]|uniref:Uncharacterized protein n=1 Tax=Mycobacterium xenopi 4042 TaxID=1299334 RepID=X7ZBW3_MYCXE|nr:hypothetical protein I553_1060 [Mycobacterium xenopi 4042]